MGFDKLAAPLAGRSVLQRALDAFGALPGVGEILVVCPPERFVRLECPAGGPPVRRVDGGADRHDSVANGLAAVAPEATHVAVHDGARPLVHPEDLARCVAVAGAEGAAALASRVAETLKRSDAAGFCTGSVSRENLWRMETPQVFAVPLLREAYAAVKASGLVVTDEVSAVEAIGGAARFVESLHPNLKITCPADLALAVALLATRAAAPDIC